MDDDSGKLDKLAQDTAAPYGNEHGDSQVLNGYWHMV